jgi:hypothetical protein
VHSVRRSVVGLAVVGLLLLGTSFGTGHALAADGAGADPDPGLTATLDGKPIPLVDVGKYDCDDFAYPEIRCWSSKVIADARAVAVTLLTAVDYVTIWDGANYGGSYLNVSEDYPALAVIGWNDRVSSFKARNSETGTFYIDWFYGGGQWNFCCNQQAPNLGSWNNTISSIVRT